jgi:hypothetical protein
MSSRYPNIPDVRDGLTEVERTVLAVIYDAKKEYGDRMVPTALLYGRVVEKIDFYLEDFKRTLTKI